MTSTQLRKPSTPPRVGISLPRNTITGTGIYERVGTIPNQSFPIHDVRYFPDVDGHLWSVAMRNAIWCSRHPEKYFYVKPYEECPFCPELKMTEKIILQQVTSLGINPQKGGWWKVELFAAFGVLGKEATLVCRGEAYLILADGVWSMPDNPDSTIKDVLLRVTGMLITDPDEYNEAIQMFGRAAMAIALDSTHRTFTIWHV